MTSMLPTRSGIVLPASRTAKESTLFDKFTRGQAESATPGVGLGLAICKSLSELMGGGIGVESRPGGGSIFVSRDLGATWTRGPEDLGRIEAQSTRRLVHQPFEREGDHRPRHAAIGRHGAGIGDDAARAAMARAAAPGPSGT